MPYIGPLLAAVAPLALAAAIDPGWRTTIYVALLFVIIEPLTLSDTQASRERTAQGESAAAARPNT